MPIDLAAQQDAQAAEKDFEYYHVGRFILHPAQWGAFAPPDIRLRWRRIRFVRENQRRVPADENGVYGFVVEPRLRRCPRVGYLMYIGETQNRGFRKRFADYLAEKGKPKRREHIVQMVEKWPEHLFFYYATVADSAEIVPLENQLLQAFLPPQNREFPASIGKTLRRVFS